MVLTDHNIAICWVWVAYIVKLCVCVRYMVVWWCAEVANCPSARVLNAGAFAARAVCGGVVLQFGRLLRWFGIKKHPGAQLLPPHPPPSLALTTENESVK